MVLEKTLEGSLDCKIKAVNPKRYQPWIFTEWTDVEAEAPILWLLDVKSRLFGKDPDAGKDWGQEEKGETENEMVGMHHWLSGHDLGQTLRDSEGQGSLACCCPWGRKELDTTEWQLKYTKQIFNFFGAGKLVSANIVCISFLESEYT